MLNTQKLLYILPDVAYVAELLPGKKPHSFSIQSFRQINGEYLDENTFIAENVIKLLSKLEDDNYHLVLPDSLFTNTIVTVKETEDKKIEAFINENLLPQLEINRETHQIAISKLTTLKGESRVQLSALEQSLLAPLRVGSGKTKNKIVAVSPLSWTLKSVVSLEPSITILQMGKNLFSALHYIGVDQAFETIVDDVEAIAETIKTLKGSEPNIQTVYLVTNAVVEEKLKDLLSDTIPLQQLNLLKEDDAKVPSYVKYCIEAGQKTISISDYPVPKFTLGKSTSEDESIQVEKLTEDKKPLEIEAADELPTLPEPNLPTISATVEDQQENDSMPATKPKSTSENETLIESKPEVVEESKSDAAPIVMDNASSIDSDTSTPSTGDVDLSQFAVHTTDDVVTPVVSEEKPTVVSATKPIKNQSGVGSMIKMIVITLVVFIATVAVGVGIGFGLLTLSKSKTPVTPTPTEVTEVAPTATPEPTPVASPSAVLNPEDVSLLVVNATTKAGYASTIKDMLTKAKFGSITASNAKGEYATAENNLVLMAEENPALLQQLEKATNLGLAFAEGYSTEDAKGTYDAVIVLTK